MGAAPQGNVPQGLHDALVAMNNKGKRIVAIPSRLAFGSQGGSEGRVPPNSDLVYQIEVVAVRVKKSSNVEAQEEASASDSEASESEKRQSTLDRMKKIGVAAMVDPSQLRKKQENPVEIEESSAEESAS